MLTYAIIGQLKNNSLDDDIVGMVHTSGVIHQAEGQGIMIFEDRFL